MAALSTFIARSLDVPFGWLLDLPRDLTLLLLACGTSLVISLVRKFVTNQDQLRRSAADLKRLAALTKEHKRRGDRTAVARTQSTAATIKLLRFRADMVVLVVSLLPVAALAIWAVERLEFLPPRVGDEVTLRAWFPHSSLDRLAHLVPAPGIELRSGPIQVIREDERDAVATWTLVAPRPATVDLVVRHQGASVVHPVRIGSRRYEPPVKQFDGGRVLATAVDLRPVRLFGVVPGIPALGFAPWLVGYLLLTIALLPIVRRVTSVA